MAAAFEDDQIPFRAFSRARPETSVASTRRSQPDDPNSSSSNMASEYGSSPVEQAALQIRMLLGRLPMAAEARQCGKIELRSRSKCCRSRKNDVSWVQTA